MLFLPEKDLRELTLKKFDSKANFKSSSYKKIFIKSARVGREAPSGSYPDSSRFNPCLLHKFRLLFLIFSPTEDSRFG